MSYFQTTGGSSSSIEMTVYVAGGSKGKIRPLLAFDLAQERRILCDSLVSRWVFDMHISSPDR